MVFLLPRRLRDKFWPEPLPPQGSFDGQTVLIKVATSGLGLAAAQHFASLGARLIITSRSIAQGESAKAQIEENTPSCQGKVHVMQLDMSRYSSCLAFVNELKHNEYTRQGLDVVVLNAGVINPEFIESPGGWEQTIQVNTLSTVLLGLLLLAWMKQTRNVSRPTPHLVFVASRDHLDPDITAWADWSTQGGILRHLSSKDNWPVGHLDPNYANSKLLLMYAIENMCEGQVKLDGKVEVIINSVCPGLVSTDIARSIVKKSTLMSLVVPTYLASMGKSADYGARFYVTAACSSPDQHGKNIQSLFTDEEYQRLAFANMQSETARRVKKLVLDEIMEELRLKVPGLDGMISA